MNPPGCTIRLTDWKRDEAALRSVRHDVFIVEQNVPANLEWDAIDAQCVHALAIEPIESFHFAISDSHANGNTCANVGTITTTFPDGGVVDTDLVMVYAVDEAGRVASMRAYWEPERAMATYRKG